MIFYVSSDLGFTNDFLIPEMIWFSLTIPASAWPNPTTRLKN
jgi:hypothetical protein